MRRYGISKTLLVRFLFVRRPGTLNSAYADPDSSSTVVSKESNNSEISVLGVDPGAIPNTSLFKES